jgi:hypothetical protein
MTHEFNSEQRYSNYTNHVFKKPQRITITLPYKTHEELIKRSNEDGRSLSNLAAYLLESALGKHEGRL